MTDAELSDAIYRSIGYLRGLASSDRCPSQDRADLLGIAEEVEELANRFFYGEEPGDADN